MNKKGNKRDTQELFNALISSSKTVKPTQVAFDLDADGRKKLRIDAARDDMTPSEKARESLGLVAKDKKMEPKITFYLSEKDMIILAEKYGIDPEDKLAIRYKAAEELINKYSEE